MNDAMMHLVAFPIPDHCDVCRAEIKKIEDKVARARVRDRTLDSKRRLDGVAQQDSEETS